MQSEYRIKILERINQYERDKLWDKDVEDDPDTIELLPNKIDYIGEKYSTRLYAKISNKIAISYFEKLIKKGQLVIKDVVGLDNYLNIEGGAIITCNHFNPCDNYAIFRAIRSDLDQKNRNLYKIIREGNYTNFKGLFGFFFRHCNTLPLSSNIETMKKFMKSISILLNRGEKILVYPEQSMWWNYKKPRPLKNGAFRFAVKNNVPVIPAFITMEDTDKLDGEGFPVQAYTVHFLPAIYSNSQFSDKENMEMLKEKNYQAWKTVYEEFYQIPLTYEG